MSLHHDLMLMKLLWPIVKIVENDPFYKKSLTYVHTVLIGITRDHKMINNDQLSLVICDRKLMEGDR